MLRWVVIVGGGIIFILLLFADKTNLTNLPEAVIQSSASTGGSKLPPLGSDPKLDTWIAEMGNLEGAGKATILDSVVSD